MDRYEFFIKSDMELISLFCTLRKKNAEERNLKALERSLASCTIRRPAEQKTTVKGIQASDIQEVNMDMPEQHQVIKMDYEQIKRELSKKRSEIDQGVRLDIGALRRREVFMVGHDCQIENRKQTPSEVVHSIRDTDYIEDRRNFVRKEVSTNRKNNQLRVANLNRRLGMDEDNQGASKSDCSFDMASLKEALPPLLHHKNGLGAKRRTRKLQDMIMNSMKENRALRVAAARFDAATVGANS